MKYKCNKCNKCFDVQKKSRHVTESADGEVIEHYWICGDCGNKNHLYFENSYMRYLKKKIEVFKENYKQEMLLLERKHGGK